MSELKIIRKLSDQLIKTKFYFRMGGFSLDNCEVLTTALLKLINKCYWNCSDDGCMSADENELSEACIKTLTVSKTYVFYYCTCAETHLNVIPTMVIHML